MNISRSGRTTALKALMHLANLEMDVALIARHFYELSFRGMSPIAGNRFIASPS